MNLASMSLDLSDPALREATRTSTVQGSSKQAWVLFGYTGPIVNGQYKLRVAATGDAGLDEFQEELSGGQVGYGFVRLESESGNTKFVYISWIPEGVPMTQSVLYAHTDAVAKFLPAHHAHINARTEEALAKEIKTALWRLR